MTKTVSHDVQSTVGAYLKEIPGALGHMDFEVRGNRVIAHEGDKTVVINLSFEGQRHLGSPDLPMTKVDIVCVGFTDDEADKFLKHYNSYMLRTGGG